MGGEGSREERSPSADEWCWVFSEAWSDSEAEKTTEKYLWMAVQYSLPQANRAAETHFMCLTEVCPLSD